MSEGVISIVGTGFVADLYMKSLRTFPGIRVRSFYDRNADRRLSFADHWRIPPAESIEDLIAGGSPDEVVLNLTNPLEHYEVSATLLRASRHVYSEKPLAVDMDQARSLYALAKTHGKLIASAPCSLLSETCQITWKAVRSGLIGRPLLVYAELDDGFISQAPYRQWISETGAPWPYEDEFLMGCTLEHAGYYLTWLIAMFGPVRTVVAASAEVDQAKLGGRSTAPDVSIGVLFFDEGIVARLTCSVVARHNHGLRIFGETGTLEVNECWDNAAPVRLRRRRRIRRRLIEDPFTRRIQLRGPTHPKVPRSGAAAMNFALGPAEMLASLSDVRRCRLSADLALHLNEVTLALQDAGLTAGAQKMTTECGPIAPMSWAEKDLR